jgi:hypothetical protein
MMAVDEQRSESVSSGSDNSRPNRAGRRVLLRLMLSIGFKLTVFL